MATHYTIEELEAMLGENLRKFRLHKNIEQKALAERAGISVRALQNLEAGTGSSVRTLLAVVRALGRQDWLDTVAPVAAINPLYLVRGTKQRQRARTKKPTSGSA